MSHPFYDAINTVLTATGSTASALTSGRMYEDQLPNDPELPALRYALITDLPHQRLASGNNVTAEIQFDVYEHRGSEANAWDVDEAVRGDFDRADLTATGFANVHSMCIQRGKPFRENRYYRIMSRYRLFGTAS